jgi:flagellar biosynthetic protein FliR
MPDVISAMLAPDRWPVFVMITARLAGLMLAAPLWSMQALPMTARAAITLVLAGILLPAVPPARLPDGMLDLLAPVALELLVGLAIGLTGAVIVQGVTFAGEVVSIQMGLNLGPALSPTADLQPAGVGQLQGLLATLVYVGFDGHLMLLRGLADSLETLPPGAPLALMHGQHLASGLLGAFFSCALQAAAPVMITLLLVNLALAIVSRAVPQLNTMLVSLPVSIAVGLVMFGAALPLLVTAVESWTQGLPGAVAQSLRAFELIRAGH